MLSHPSIVKKISNLIDDWYFQNKHRFRETTGAVKSRQDFETVFKTGFDIGHKQLYEILKIDKKRRNDDIEEDQCFLQDQLGSDAPRRWKIGKADLLLKTKEQKSQK